MKSLGLKKRPDREDQAFPNIKKSKSVSLTFALIIVLFEMDENQDCPNTYQFPPCGNWDCPDYPFILNE
jgi:hypothetical protein